MTALVDWKKRHPKTVIFPAWSTQLKVCLGETEQTEEDLVANELSKQSSVHERGEVGRSHINTKLTFNRW